MGNEEWMNPTRAPVIRLTMCLSLLALLAAFLAVAAACGQASPPTPTPVRQVTASALTRAYQNDPEEQLINTRTDTCGRFEASLPTLK